MRPGASATYQESATSIFGRTVSTSTRAWTDDRQCMLVIIGADEYGTRMFLASWTGSARTRTAGETFFELEETRADDCARSGLWGRCHGFLDRTAGRVSRRRKNSAAGSTRWPTSRARCPSQYMKRPRQGCKTSGWQRRRKRPLQPLISLWKPTA